VLTGDEFGYTKADIDLAEDVLVRARRAGLIPWEAISDGRTAKAAPWVVAGPEDLAQQQLDELPSAQLDRQAGQATRVEVWAEAMGWLPRLERIANDRGVTVYSGSGSVPVPAVRAAATRAIRAFADHDQRTVVLSIGDLDLNGIRNIARPFEEDLLQMTADLLDLHADDAGGLVSVRRLLLTADQVDEHIGERARVRPSREAIKAGWPYPFTAQAEALAPEVRDRIVADAIDALHDVEARDRIVAREADLHDAARREIARRLNGAR
jgi:hypothetical protein